MNSIELDFLVVGGGPAGAACATLLAQRGAQVALVEASNFTQFRMGETISSVVRSLLARLELSIEDGADWLLPSASTISAWGSSDIGGRSSLKNPYGRGWRVDRRSFDRLLFDHAGTAGAKTFRESRVGGVHRHEGRWNFSLTSGHCSRAGRAAFVVEATGRKGNSRFALRVPRMWIDQLVGLAIVGQAETLSHHFRDSTLVESVPGGWWYSVVLPGDRLLAVFFTDGDLLPRGKVNIGHFLIEQLRLTEYTRDRCASIRKRLESTLR